MGLLGRPSTKHNRRDNNNMTQQHIDIVDELRAKQSRDNRDLLDRAADEIERLREGIKAIIKGAEEAKG